MRAIIQRVSQAEVAVAGQIVGAITHGMVVLLGIGQGDSTVQIEQIGRKILELRIFDDESGTSESLSYSDDGFDSAGAAGSTALKWSRISASNADGTLHLSVLASPPFLKARVRQASDAHK